MTPIGGSTPSGPGRVELAVQADLEAIGQAESTLGASALELARKMDERADTGSALASMIARLQLVMNDAKAAGVAPAGTLPDRLRQAREARIAKAMGA